MMSAGAAGGLAGPPVDLTITSRAEKPSKNSNAANHHIVCSANTLSLSYRVVPARRDLRMCRFLYDTMMMGARELPSILAGACISFQLVTLR
jgi:hypothetical protein